MSAVDPWEPAEKDWKEYVEPMLDRPHFDHAFFETDCPGCHKHVGALVVDGPDPVFADLTCPLCGHEWAERIA